MLRYLVPIALFSIANLSAADEERTLRDDLIDQFPLAEVNAHTCRRVAELGQETVSPEQCRARLEDANAECRQLAPDYVGENPTEEEVPVLGAIIMVCPVAEVLGISFRIIDGKAHVGWSELHQEDLE